MKLDKKQIKELRKAAKKGDTDATAQLCRLYRIAARQSYGRNGERFSKAAIVYGEKSAQAGNPQGIAELFLCLEELAYSEYSGISKSYAKIYEKMADRLKAAAEAGNADAQYYLGMSYFRVPFGRSMFGKDNAAAAMWLERAAGQGHVLAAYFLGMRYARGMGISQDDEKAAALLSAASQKGHGLSAAYCSLMYPDSLLSVRNELVDELIKRADAYIDKLSKKRHSDLDYNNKHIDYWDKYDSLEIISQKVRNAADRGMSRPDLLYESGLRAYYGTPECPRDTKEGRKFIKYAAECGHKDAENTYACILLSEHKNRHTMTKALQYIADAAEQFILDGDIPPIYDLHDSYYNYRPEMMMFSLVFAPDSFPATQAS